MSIEHFESQFKLVKATFIYITHCFSKRGHVIFIDLRNCAVSVFDR
jgi:hypothetical protein